MIIVEYNRHGYTVLSNGAEIYAAGNHKQDSTAHESDPRFAESLRTIRKHAIQSGHDLAEERGEIFGGVERIDRIED